jgi:hypothetical protein
MPTLIIPAFLLFAAAFSLGCQTAANTATTANTSNTSNTTTNTMTSNSAADAAEPKSEAPQTDLVSVGSLATPTEAYKTAYALRKKKDIAGLKKVMSNDVLEFLTMMGEVEKKSLDEMIKEMVEKPQADKAEVRKEKINGNRAELEYLTETGEWKTMDFEKIDGKWVMTLPKAENPSGKEPEL